jgi:glutamine synthetase
LSSGTVEHKVLHEIADVLHEAGIELQMFHAESAPGQVRLSVAMIAPC